MKTYDQKPFELDMSLVWERLDGEPESCDCVQWSDDAMTSIHANINCVVCFGYGTMPIPLSVLQ